MKYYSSIIGLIFLLMIGTKSYAQDDWENDGEIEDVEIEIVKDRSINLPVANRNFEKIAPVTITDEKGEMEYFFSTLTFDVPGLDLKMRPLRIKDQPLSKFYGNYVKAGFGNYSTPYLEAFVNSKRDKRYSYGAHFNWLNSKNGPVDDENSGSGEMDVDLFGKAFGDQVTASGSLGYHRRNYHFYGYDDGTEIDEDSIEQVFNTISIAAKLSNTDQDAPLSYTVGLNYDYITDDYEAKESEIMILGQGRYNLSDASFVDIQTAYHSISREDDVLDDQRNLFTVQPVVGFELEGFTIEAGFNVAYEDDTLGESDDLHFFPVAKASYALSTTLKAYAGIRGGIVKQTLRSIVNSNPYIQSDQGIYHNHKTFDFYGGLEGKLSSKTGFSVGLSAANYKNLHYFINDPTDRSRFLIAYDDDNTAVLNLFAELTYSSGPLRAALRGDYWGYDVNDKIGNEAWHRPNYQLSALSTYNLYDKLLFTANWYVYGGIEAIDIPAGEEVKLDAAFDLNLKADYLISKQVSAFVAFNNIFSQSYELLYRYPTRELQFMLGFTYSF